jgi:predicted phage terminase large subunit-like protein
MVTTLNKPSESYQILGQSGWESLDNINIPWTDYIPVQPTTKQWAFLMLNCLEAFYGGAGGGGKSYALLMASLQYVDYPGYAALLLRRTYKDLSKPGALMEVSKSWLSNTDARWSEKEATWHFPSGATLTFGYLETSNDKWQYQGGSYQFIGWDELTQFQELDYRFLFGWNRRTLDSTIPLRVRGASNPGGIGHEWVKQRFITEGIKAGRPFIPAKMGDNPYLDLESYDRSLAELDSVTRAQIKEGDWTARQAGNKFDRSWFEIVDAAPADCRKLRFWDMAATEPKPGKDPDWTSGTLMGISKNGTVYIIDIKRMRGTPNANESLIKQTAQLDGREVPIRMEQEPGSSGVKMIDDYRRRVLMGWDFKGIPSTGSKEVRANPLSSQAGAGNVKLVRGAWIGEFLDEAEAFPNGSHDDQVDSASGAFNELTLATPEPEEKIITYDSMTLVGNIDL